MKKNILVKGPVLSQSGYGQQARFALRALKHHEDKFEVFILPISWGKTGWIWENSEFREWIDERITITQILIQKRQLEVDISLQVTIPNEFEKIAPINIGYTAGIETTKVSPQWLQKGNEMDKMLVVSNHAKVVYENTVTTATNTNTGETVPYKLQTPIDVVWENTPRNNPQPIPDLELDYDYNFLTVSQISPRKNFTNSIQWFVEEFIDQEVGLIVKTNIINNSLIDWEHLQIRVKDMLNKYQNRKCKVYLLHGDLTSGQMTWLYQHDKIKGLVNIAHGEGFGLPMFEAAREGLPVATIGWSGQVDFLTHDHEEYFQSIDYTIQPVQNEAVWPGVIEKEAMWAYADQGSYKMKLRDMYKNYEDCKTKAVKLKDIIDEKFSNERLYKIFVDAILEKAEEEAEIIVL